MHGDMGLLRIVKCGVVFSVLPILLSVAPVSVFGEAGASDEGAGLTVPDGLPVRTLRKLARAPKPTEALKAMKSVCKSVRDGGGRSFLYKSEISPHINPGDPRASGPTLVCNQVCSKSSRIPLYYSDGTLAAVMGYYGRWNVTGRPRYYCAAGGTPACSNRTLARDSRARGRDGKIYVKLDSTCWRVNPIGRTGSPT